LWWGLAVIFFGFGNGGAAGWLCQSDRARRFLRRWLERVSCLRSVSSWRLIRVSNWSVLPPVKPKTPQVTLKRAINNILWRILIFYVGAIFRHHHHLPVE
jgi:amino acid transporter, AAT family